MILRTSMQNLDTMDSSSVREPVHVLKKLSTDLKARITEALATFNNAVLGHIWQEMDYQLHVRCITQVSRIEHL